MRTCFLQSAVVCAAFTLSTLGFSAAGAPATGEHAAPMVAAALDNPFEGSWSGTFLNLDSGEGGVLEWTIDANGRLRGTYLWDSGASGTFVGVALSNGVLHVAAPGGGGAYTGQAHLDANGDMVLQAFDVDGGDEYSVVLSPK